MQQRLQPQSVWTVYPRDFSAELASYKRHCSASLESRSTCNNISQIDYVKFAELGGYANANSASVSFGGVKKRLLALPDADFAASVSTPKKGAAKSKNAAADETNAAIDDDEATPAAETPKPKAVRKPKAAPKADNEDVAMGDENADQVAPTTKKRGRGAKDPNAPPAKRQRQAPKKEEVTEPAVHANPRVQPNSPAKVNYEPNSLAQIEHDALLAEGYALVKTENDSEKGGEEDMYAS